jgi:hypothetical protein
MAFSCQSRFRRLRSPGVYRVSGAATLVNAIMQVATRVQRRGFARWTFHFFARKRNPRGCREQKVDKSAFGSDLGVRKTRTTILAFYNPPWSRPLAHDSYA